MKIKTIESEVLPPGRPAGGTGGKAPGLTILLALSWLGGLGCCMAWISHYSATPGPAGQSPAHWPSSTHILRDPRLPTLVVFAHPQCPCTAATMGELALLLAWTQGKVAAQVWFLKPANTPDDWTNTGLWRAAAAIPGVSVHEDRDGCEARRFQAETSGEAVLYRPNGQLLFHGGITESRGHSGDNAGRSAITALILGEPAAVTQTPVFGCSLFNSNCLPEGSERLP